MAGDRRPLWDDWLARWDRFQASYVPHRDEQFGVMMDAIAMWWRGKSVRALDLGCGPGSVGSRLLGRIPNALVVGVDFDPWLLEMGRQTSGSGQRRSWVEGDLRESAWNQALGHDFEVVLSATTLHRFDANELARIYRAAVKVLVKDGLFLNADVLPAGSPRVARFAREMLIRWQARRIAESAGESWYAFWAAARRQPEFAELIAERDRRLEPRPAREAIPVEVQRELLLSAGFRDVGEIWRWHESAILLAIR